MPKRKQEAATPVPLKKANKSSNTAGSSVPSKPYRCSQCSNSYSQSNGLARHFGTCHGDTSQDNWECTERDCNKAFSRWENRERHQKTHTYQGYLRCPGCDWNGRADYLLKHLQSKNGARCRASAELAGADIPTGALDDWLRDALCYLGNFDVEEPLTTSDECANDETTVDEISSLFVETNKQRRKDFEEMDLDQPADIRCSYQSRHGSCYFDDSLNFGLDDILAGVGSWCEDVSVQPDSGEELALLFEWDLDRICDDEIDTQLDGISLEQLLKVGTEDQPCVETDLEHHRPAVVRTFAVSGALMSRAIASGEARTTSWASIPDDFGEARFEASVAFQACPELSTQENFCTMDESPDHFVVLDKARPGETSVEQAMHSYEVLDDFGEDELSRKYRLQRDPKAGIWRAANASRAESVACKICGERCQSSKEAVLTHAWSHYRTRPVASHACKICGVRFLFKRDWYLHVTSPGQFRSISECYPPSACDEDDQVGQAIKEDLRIFERQLRLWEGLQLQQYFRALILAFGTERGRCLQQRECISLPTKPRSPCPLQAESVIAAMSDCADAPAIAEVTIEMLMSQFERLSVLGKQDRRQAPPMQSRRTRTRRTR